MTPSVRLEQIATRVGGRLRGDGGRRIRGVASLHRAGPDELSFLASGRHRTAARDSRAGALLVCDGEPLEDRDCIEVAHVYAALAQALELFHPPRECRPGVHPDARVAPDAELGRVEVGPFAVIEAGAQIRDGCILGAGCFVGEATHIGQHSVLMPGVVVYPGSRIGARCLVHAGVVLGADGFGYASTGDGHHKIPQVGGVVLEDDVEVGANSTIDRGSLDDTVVGTGSKIDNLVMVAHGVRLGPRCMLIAQSGISGSTRLGAGVVIAGQSGAADHLQIGDGAAVGAKSAVLQDVEAGAVVSGIPATDHGTWKRTQALARRLPELRRELRELSARVADLERRLPEED